MIGGVGVALVTLFDDDGKLLAHDTAALAGALVDAGIRFVVVAGTTGEAPSLSRDERANLLDAVVATVGGRVPVVAGTGAPSVTDAVGFTEAACAGGADAVLALSPPGAGPDAMRRYYEAVAAAASVPVLAYHFPKVSAPGIPVDLLGSLPVAGVKDSTGDPKRLAAELALDPAVPVFVGSATLLALAGPLGAAGAILAMANAAPDDCLAAFAGDIEAQRRVNEAHLRAKPAGIAGLKSLVAARFRTSTATRSAAMTSHVGPVPE